MATLHSCFRGHGLSEIATIGTHSAHFQTRLKFALPSSSPSCSQSSSAQTQPLSVQLRALRRCGVHPYLRQTQNAVRLFATWRPMQGRHRERWNNGTELKAALATTEVGAHQDGDGASGPTPAPETLEEIESRPMLAGWMPPRYLWRAIAAFLIAGQVVIRSIRGRVHLRNTLQQLELVGPRSLGVSLLTASFVGMVFTIQFVREFARLGLTRSVGGVLALALARELSPVVTAIIMAGRVGSAFAAELGTMQVSEQTDTLRVLRTDPVDYLVTPRVIACCVSLPILTTMCFAVAMAASVLLADSVYNVSANIILESAARALQPWDLISTSIKSVVFGGIISIVSCTWGVTTLGGAKGVGESTTSAVVISLVCIFIADFILSWLFFQGAGDALKAAMGLENRNIPCFRLEHYSLGRVPLRDTAITLMNNVDIY